MTDDIKSPAYQFDEIAFLYDELMEGVPYIEWLKYINQILVTFEGVPEKVLDLCCGTGRVSMMLAEQGFKVSGIDISSGMIQLAKRNSQKKGLDIDFHVQDASCFSMPDRYDLVISLFDSLNYILDIKALQQCFNRVADHLAPDGLFIFDMNTELALAAGLFNQNNKGSKTRLIYNWKSSYNYETGICAVEMDFEYGREHGKKIQIVHHQRAYDLGDIASMLVTAGFDILAVYDAYNFRRVSAKSDRVFFVARKISDQQDMSIL